MTASARKVLTLMRDIAAFDDGHASLTALARRSGWSLSNVQRRFQTLAGETPRAFTQRVRLERASADLISSTASILEIALRYGFASHEVFSRAFTRHFGRTPREHRTALRATSRQPRPDINVQRSVSPCVRLFGLSLDRTKEPAPMPDTSIERRTLEEQPILFIRRRIAATALQLTMSECFGALYTHGHAAGLAVAGHPIARYVTTGPGLWTVDLAMPLSTPASSVGEMQSGVLPAGPVAFAVHQGPYDQLPLTNAAVEAWIEQNGHEVGGAPWEWYVTSPGEVPDPADWRTEVVWPLKS